MNGDETRTTCLVADDHPAVLQAVSDILDDSGISVVARVTDGAAAAERIEALRPQVALLDVRMPGLSGIDVARRVARSAADSPNWPSGVRSRS